MNHVMFILESGSDSDHSLQLDLDWMSDEVEKRADRIDFRELEREYEIRVFCVNKECSLENLS